MTTSAADIGVVGLAVMGQNLALNLADQGLTVAVTNRSPGRIDELLARAEPRHRLIPTPGLVELVAELAAPRVVLLMVKAGDPVDATIDQLVPLLDPGDSIVDGGNSHWLDSERRQRRLADCGIAFVGAGISGGEEGARRGPSIMPGGSVAAWPRVAPLLEAVAARADDGEPCVAWLGAGGAGHFVKMVHNGIEYGDMQILAEGHTLLRAAGYEPADQAELFRQWNEGRLASFLVEITGDILAATDPAGGGPLIDVILDAAGQKGTGRWTVTAAMELGQPLVLVAEAVGARMVSSLVDLRASVADRHGAEAAPALSEAVHPGDVEAAMWMAKVMSYTQGFMLLQAASDEQGWDLDLATVARLWRAGCIIRAEFLADIARVHEAGPVTNLLLTDRFADEVAEAAPSLRWVVTAAVEAGIAVPALASALTFYDGLRTRRGSGHLIQAQRDHFGAHTYERVDRPRGQVFHTDWIGSGDSATSGSYRA